ncbi:MAG: dienelactone hydrolase family protein [Burkholderiales bacterium]
MREPRLVNYAGAPGQSIRSYLSLPDGGDSRPAIVVLRGVAGGDEGYIEIASRLSDWGYVTLVHGWHGGGSNPSDDLVLGDLQGAFDYLTTVERVLTERVAVIGFCKGGIYAFMAAARQTAVRTVIVFHGFAYRAIDADHRLQPYDLADAVNVPVMLLHGTEDRSASIDDIRALDARLRARGAICALRTYPGAEHGFAVSTHPNFSADHAALAFEEARSFLGRHFPITTPRSSS